MDINTAIKQLRTERDDIDATIRRLERFNTSVPKSNAARRAAATTPAAHTANDSPRRTMSEEHRRKISEALKRRHQTVAA